MKYSLVHTPTSHDTDEGTIYSDIVTLTFGNAIGSNIIVEQGSIAQGNTMELDMNSTNQGIAELTITVPELVDLITTTVTLTKSDNGTWSATFAGASGTDFIISN